LRRISFDDDDDDDDEDGDVAQRNAGPIFFVG
jgi:hypothetical protein